MKTLPRLVTRMAAASAAVSFAVLPVLPAGALPAEDGTEMLTVDALTAGYQNVVAGEQAGIVSLTLNSDGTGGEIRTYCIEFGEDSDLSPHGYSTTAMVAVDNLDRVRHIAVNAASIGTPLSDANLEAAARQVAIWELTDEAAFDHTEINNASLVARVDELLADGGSMQAPQFSQVNLAVDAVRDGDLAVVTAALTGDAGAPLAGQVVSITVAGGDAVDAVTDDNGQAILEVSPGPSETEVTADWSGQIGAGALLAPGSDDEQEKLAIDPIPVSRTAAATVAAAPTPETTAPPTTEAPPVTEVTEPPTTPTTVPDELPYTGQYTGGLLAAGAAAAAGFGIWMRRRSLGS